MFRFCGFNSVRVVDLGASSALPSTRNDWRMWLRYMQPFSSAFADVAIFVAAIDGYDEYAASDGGNRLLWKRWSSLSVYVEVIFFSTRRALC